MLAEKSDVSWLSSSRVLKGQIYKQQKVKSTCTKNGGKVYEKDSLLLKMLQFLRLSTNISLSDTKNEKLYWSCLSTVVTWCSNLPINRVSTKHVFDTFSLKQHFSFSRNLYFYHKAKMKKSYIIIIPYTTIRYIKVARTVTCCTFCKIERRCPRIALDVLSSYYFF